MKGKEIIDSETAHLYLPPAMQKPNDLISATEARIILDVSPKKMSDLVKSGAFRTFEDLLDKRKKYFSRAEVESFKSGSVRERAA
jgi:hypothetical protein